MKNLNKCFIIEETVVIVINVGILQGMQKKLIKLLFLKTKFWM